MNVPKPIRSNRFDCPYATQARCDAWPGWRFQKGTQHMSGSRALIYSRIRENPLDPSETDVTRGARQQDVMDAVAAEVHLDRHADADAVLGQLAREASDHRPDRCTARAARLGEVPRRRTPAQSTAGSAATSAAAARGSPSEDNPATIAMFLGRSAPQPPTDAFDPGCVTGHVLK